MWLFTHTKRGHQIAYTQYVAVFMVNIYFVGNIKSCQLQILCVLKLSLNIL